MNIKYREITSSETEIINQISNWYFNEWKIPKRKTIKSLTAKSNRNVIFQTLMSDSEVSIGTGGLYQSVEIENRIKKYQNYSPWIALMYTKPGMRRKGLGGKLLDRIELEAQKRGYQKIYLFTHSAESLYIRKGWNEIERHQIEGKNIVIMEKKYKTTYNT